MQLTERLIRRESYIEKLNKKQTSIHEFQHIENITREKQNEKIIFENINLQLKNEIQTWSNKYHEINAKAESYLKVRLN